ncbi:ABC transporter permease [Lutibaculum baratangense]|uniref:L-proline glycine betaine ABC transport system permease protein ProW n=1 Tax=Lutibaculum baratangense AMV1 TaxID=631454 RepID=V4TN62_9HYPH|nr:ABC transporter permease subunit [Lutibaculum baratangense]ESR27163.1 L-proline glycine betaine ABC transport system permease protein ProW [Lutibaculum baratangense AMV1]
MTALAPTTHLGRDAEAGLRPRHKALLLLGAFVALVALKHLLPAGLVRPPDWVILPVGQWLSAAFEFLREDLGLEAVTRLFAGFVAWHLEILGNLLLGGRGGLGLPALPWTVIAVSGFMIGYALQGWRLAALSGGVFVYLALFGQWRYAMETLSLIAVSAPLAVLAGLALGIAAARHPRLEAALMPLLNVMQSMPHFAYLIPVVVFFGVGDHAGAVATAIFATPPMVRMTLLGMRRLPPEVVEAGMMAGATRWQRLRHVEVPTAREDILVGVNQVIMQCLAMVVIASFIGAPGLGYRLLLALQSLKIGTALELGVSIVLIAITLDRCSKAWVERRPVHDAAERPWHERHRTLLVWLGLVALAFAAASLHPWAYEVPRRQALSTAPFWDAIVDWTTVALFEPAHQLRTMLSLHVLIPLRDLYLYLPFAAVALAAAGGGYLVGGLRSALVCLGFVAFVALTGWWDRAMITLYMVSFAVFVCLALGLPLGIWASRSDGRGRRVLLLCDTFQTFPSFIYLIPMVMLFQVNDVAAIGAVIIYAMIPIVRYTVEGMRSVPSSLHEAVRMAGADGRQRLLNMELPMALPHILVGINQTIMFALFMVIIAAFIGTQDLGQELMRALSANDIGKGLTLGLCVASIGLLFDHILTEWARRRKAALGLA